MWPDVNHCLSLRDEILELDQWESVIQSRQAIPFLRVFGSAEPLDGTLVHPDDYVLAHKLMKTLEIELPPNAPPGYNPPSFDAEPELIEPARLSEVEKESQPIPVENFDVAQQEAADFQVGDTESPVAVDDSETAETTAVESTNAEPEASVIEASDGTTEASEESADQQSVPAEKDRHSEPVVTTEGESPAATAETESDTQTAKAPEAPEIHPVVKRPMPEKAKIDKCVKEWQIGSNRANQIVNWLCDPFGDSDASGTPPAVLAHMPTTKGLKPGDSVIGVVVSVMPFGAFVELAPDCSGLVHVSRVSETFVEDLHEAVQVGDIVTAWVVGIDEKRRRVALSAISPERANELEQQRHARSDRGRFRDTRQPRPGARGGDRQQATGGNRSQAVQASGGAAARGGRAKPQGKSNEGQRDRGRQGGRAQGGRAQGGRAQGGRAQGGGRGGRGRERRPESYRVESKEEIKPISEEMQKGKEPMRTFGDLAQFFGTAETKNKPAEPPAEASRPKDQEPMNDSSSDSEPKDSPARPEPATESPEPANLVQQASDDAHQPPKGDSEPATGNPESASPPAKPELQSPDSAAADTTPTDNTASDAPTT